MNPRPNIGFWPEVRDSNSCQPGLVAVHDLKEEGHDTDWDRKEGEEPCVGADGTRVLLR